MSSQAAGNSGMKLKREDRAEVDRHILLDGDGHTLNRSPLESKEGTHIYQGE